MRPPQQLVTRQIRIEANASETRTQLAPDGYNVQWSPGDRIGVYVESGDTFTTTNTPLTFEGTEAAASGTFSGEITLTEGAASYTLYAYYPYGRPGRRVRRASLSRSPRNRRNPRRATPPTWEPTTSWWPAP